MLKTGDIVKHGTAVGLVVDMTHKKAWRVHEKGVKINWDKVEPEDHAVVMHDCGTQVTIPAIDLEVINGSK